MSVVTCSPRERAAPRASFCAAVTWLLRSARDQKGRRVVVGELKCVMILGAVELQTTRINILARIDRASSCRPSWPYVLARLARARRECSFPIRQCASAIDNSEPLARTTRPRISSSCKPLPSSFIARPNLGRLRPPKPRLPARPPERALHDAVVVLLAEPARIPPPPPRFAS